MNTLSEFIRQREQESTLRNKQFPLESLLFIYSRSHKKDTYINCFEGFKLLVEWLSPIGIPRLDPEFKFSPLLYNYEQQEIAKILGCDPRIIQQTILRSLLHGLTSKYNL